MKHIFRKNQVIITALAIMIAVAGYLQFNQDKVDDYGQNTEATMDAVTQDGTVDVDADAASATDDAAVDADSEAITDNDETADISDEDSADDAIPVADNGEMEAEADADKDSEETAGEAVLVNTTINSDFFATAKLQREQTRAKNKDLLMEIVDNENLSEEQKENAINEVLELTNIADKENATETLLKAKGFSDAVVTISDDKAIVVVSAEQLTDQQKAQIEDIVKNQTKIEVKNITISPAKVEQE